MIITRTPLRISFVGGGTDLSYFYRKHGGCVVSMAVNKYFYLSMHKYFEEQGFLLKYSQTEHAKTKSEIEHRIIREVFEMYDLDRVDFSSAADVPAGTGMGSSSAFTSGLIALCDAYTGKQRSQSEIAKLACEVEIERLGEPIGKQDQYGCALGGLKKIRFMPDDTVVVEPIFLAREARQRLEDSLLLIRTGGTRSASAQLEKQQKNVKNDAALEENMKAMAAQAEDLAKRITTDVDCIGEFLHEGWERKKKISAGISNPDIDDIYARARSAGATGGKLLGAGGAGFILAYAPGGAAQNVREALSDKQIEALRVDNAGSIVIYNDQV